MERIKSILLLILSLAVFLNADALRLTSGNIQLNSDRGDSTLLRQAVYIIQKEKKIYPNKFGLTLDKPLKIYFYYDQDAMGQHLHAVPYWSGGIARSGTEIHIYGSNRNQWLSTLSHELFHALLGQNDIKIPVWLNEGLAQWQSGQSDWGHFMELGTATAREQLIPLVDLDVILSFNHKRASLAYGQALDATRYLIKTQGESILPFLLRNDDLSFRERFKIETKGDLIDFEIDWRKDLETRLWFFKISQIPPMLWAFSPLLVILAWFIKYRRGKEKLQEWELEEREDLN
jgi:hypothetical protein